MDAAEERWSLARGTAHARAPLQELLAPTEDGMPVGHVLFVGTTRGYEIVESEGEPPKTGDILVLFDRRYRVGSARRSPFPGDPRPCFTVEPVES